jgi:putative cell wall-binding protein
MASVLAVVAGTPAQAANTSSEVLVDDEREFGGRDRYDTALRLAENFANGKGGLGQVPTAFVASGLTLVDAVSVSGLTGFLDAPVLLTQTNNLHGGVADYIDDYGVDTIYVLGGSAAIADSVLEDMEALANEPTVSRIEGADRYATAAAIASKLGGGAAWCGGEDAAAILVNGGDVSLAEAMMVGPIAHRLQLPVLLTAADELPSATTAFIESEDIEHVIVVGGADSVSEDIEDALIDVGVDAVERIAGDTPAGTSVELAKLAFDGCADDLDPVAAAMAALVHRDALPDGVTAAPVLTSTFANGALVPILIVGDTLPASVRDYLAATPEEDADSNKVDYQIVAIGGTAAVSQSVMDAALAAASSADALTVQIGASEDKNDDGEIDVNDVPAPGDMSVRLYFSDDVIADETDLTAIIRDIIERNGAPARLADPPVAHDSGADGKCSPDEVTVNFSGALKAGDTISVVAGAKLGADEDARSVGSATLTVAAAAVDRTRPTISVIMIADRNVAEVTVSDDDPPLTADANAADVTIRSDTADQTVTVNPDGNLAFDSPLVAGDRVTIASGAIEDAAGNRSLQRSFTAIAPHKSPRITSVLMSTLKHSAQAETSVPVAIAGAGNVVTITAKADGAAAGAAGNVWHFVFDVASTWTADGDQDIDVRVNSRDTTVFVRFNDGSAKNGDLKAVLEGNNAFSSMFEVKLPADADGGCDATADNDLALGTDDRQEAADPASGGTTEVAIEVRFNGYVNTIDDDELLADILAGVVVRAEVETNAATLALGLDSLTEFAGPGTTHRYEASTGDAGMLPAVRDLVNTDAGYDLSASDADQKIAAAAEVAVGYASDDDTTTTVQENKNASSQVRIGRSSGVKQPGA